MSLPKSIVASFAIIAAVWGMAFAQTKLIPQTQVAANYKTPVQLIGKQRSASEEKLAQAPDELWRELTYDQALFDQLSDKSTVTVYALYQGLGGQSPSVTLGYAASAFNTPPSGAFSVPGGHYQALIQDAATPEQIATGWQQLDRQRAVEAVLEKYTFDGSWNLLSANSQVLYR